MQSWIGSPESCLWWASPANCRSFIFKAADPSWRLIPVFPIKAQTHRGSWTQYFPSKLPTHRGACTQYFPSKPPTYRGSWTQYFLSKLPTHRCAWTQYFPSKLPTYRCAWTQYFPSKLPLQMWDISCASNLGKFKHSTGRFYFIGSICRFWGKQPICADNWVTLKLEWELKCISLRQ